MFIREHQQLLCKYKAENTPTPAELEFEEILKTYNVKYMKQKGFVSGCNTCLIADFYIPKPYKIIFEIDGEYHLTRVKKDYGRDQFFKIHRGINTIRFNNKDILNNKEYIINVLNNIFKQSIYKEYNY
jgi:very-short-patch-repair endonuclease